ncbi:hypothetical protein [Shouchella clausii]|uniref:WxL domain-containing protein n=1 Tax=Shouchella clausii TaxID=79880 RepID=A0A268NW29_SHOCL|nr:hypothetical protein [Shouchella clausii]PAE87686.1 hypothetical protein CHH72_17115 [Shouchella clausii]
MNKWRKRVLLPTLLAFGVMVASEPMYANTGEDGGVEHHELFDFEAVINHHEIEAGTAPFDKDDKPGNSSGNDNFIVRTWDTITYPVKITMNSKTGEALRNIDIQLSGTLDGGMAEDRVNAKFAVGNKEDYEKKEVAFVQNYTIEQTGNSIMVPVTINVLGARHGVELTPDIKVQVMSVDGQDISADNVVTHFDTLPPVKTSAKVSVKPFINGHWAGIGSMYYPYARMTGSNDDYERLYYFGVAWGIDRLPGKSDIRGATFPDPEGKLHYTVELDGDVYWDVGEKRGQREKLDFTGRDTPLQLFDHRSANRTREVVGSKNTMKDGEPYRFDHSHAVHVPNSSFSALDSETIEKEKHNSVRDSGTWEVSKPDIGRNMVRYEGTNTGFKIGSTFPTLSSFHSPSDTGINDDFGVNDKLFASRTFILFSSNEYRLGAKNNKTNPHHNNVTYRAKVTLVGYTDENGKYEAINKGHTRSFTERNNLEGLSAQTDFISNPGKEQLGTSRSGWASVSKGDASTIVGGDVFLRSRLWTDVNLYGGHEGVYRWNTDAFELTEEYAKEAERSIYHAGYWNISLDRVRNNKEKQFVQYGVPKFKDNSFKSFTAKGIDDYDWYDTFKEARQKGEVGALKNDVRTAIGPKRTSDPEMPLRVKHENIGIGSETKNGTPNITVTNFYVYPDENREQRVDISSNRSYGNPAKWNKDGEMEQIQTPNGSTVNFETLAVVPAEVSTNISAEKDSYYNSETIKWIAENGIVLPRNSGLPDGADGGVRIEHTLPKGLDYKIGSGKIGNIKTDPIVTETKNGEKVLTWELFISDQKFTLDDIEFETTINPFALSTSGVSSRVEIKGVIHSELDRRPEHRRTSKGSTSILKVGMVGIYQSINEMYGDLDSEFTLRLSPYTTIEDEQGVKGLTVIPLSGDSIGSKYSGSAVIKDIKTSVKRLDKDKDVTVYLNKKPIYSDRPHEIDPTKDGWVKYTGSKSQLDGAVSLLFHIDGKLTNQDEIAIDVTIKTDGNKFGDEYFSETVINSDTNYRLSPLSNRVRYMIRADLELSLERVQIYTNPHDQGLPVYVRVAQHVQDIERVKNSNVTLAIYDTESGKKVAEKKYKQNELKVENELHIPAKMLEKADVANYEVRIEGIDPTHVWVHPDGAVLDTDGHTSIQGTLTEEDVEDDGDEHRLNFEGVIMTERERGREMVTYNETIEFSWTGKTRVKSGYGFEYNSVLSYTNDRMADIAKRFDQVNYSTDASVALDHRLVDSTLAYYDQGAGYKNNDRVSIALDRDAPSNGQEEDVRVSLYELPQVYLEQGTGYTYTGTQKENGEIRGDALEAGNRLYVPVWIDDTGKYDASFVTDEPLGSHRMSLDVNRLIDVYAYMFNHTDSRTPDDDELLVHPMVQNDIPENWGTDE